jgi:hypothetical protein
VKATQETSQMEERTTASLKDPTDDIRGPNNKKRPERRLALEDLRRVERLLVRLEAQSRGSLPSTYARSISKPSWKLSRALLIGSLLFGSFSLPILTIAYVRFENRNWQFTDDTNDAPTRVIVASPRVKTRTIERCVDSVASSFNESSRRIKPPPQTRKYANASLEQGASEPRSRPIALSTSKVSSPGTSYALHAFANEAQGERVDTILSLKPSDAASAHTGRDGMVDYWVMPRGPFFDTPARVVPIGRNVNGVFVRNLEDKRNYRLTSSGEWHLLIPPTENK